MSIVNTILPDWILLIKENQQFCPTNTKRYQTSVRVDGKDFVFLNITSKSELKFKKETPVTAQKKMQNKISRAGGGLDKDLLNEN